MNGAPVRVTEVLGLIPARGGSKGIPRKNVAGLGGRPLLAYTCEAALASSTLTRTVLSTDDGAIADVGRACGVEVPFLRPAGLSADETPMIDVVRHALRALEQAEGYRPDVLVLLQPTSPLRRARHIDDAVDLLCASGADSVVTVVPVPHRFSPTSVMRLVEGRLVAFAEGPAPARRQDKPRLYARNGPAVLAVKRSVVLDQASLYGDDCRPLVMDAESSVDVDEPADLAYAEHLLERRGAQSTESDRVVAGGLS